MKQFTEMAESGERNFESLLDIQPTETVLEYKRRVNEMLQQAFEIASQKQ